MAGQAIVTIQNSQWQVALANAPWELITGLGGLSGLEPGSGMLFDLGYDTAITVTTQPMLFPLDIAFISSSLMVVDVARGVYPGCLVTSRRPARYFLEVNAGELQDIDVDTKVEIGLLAQQSQPDWLSCVVSLATAMLVMALALSLVKSMLRAALAEPQAARLAQTLPYLTPGQEGPAARLVEKWSRSAKRNSSLALRELEELHRRYGYTVDDCRQALIEYRDIQREDYADAEEYQEARDEAWERFLECLEELAAEEEEELTSAKPEPEKLPKPTRSDVSVGAWQERDRLGIWISDNRTGKTIAEWWDDEAREMFDQGFFKPGVPQYSWEKPGPGFVASVLDYAESVGLLARGGASGAATYLSQVNSPTRLDGLQIVNAYKQISRQGEDEICVQLQAWAVFPQGKKPHFISMYRSGDRYIISPLYAHVEHSVEVPVDRVKVWIKSLPVRHLEPMAVAPQYREEAERLAKEVDEPIDILPLPHGQINLPQTKLSAEQIAGERQPIPFTPAKQLQRDNHLYVTEETVPDPVYGYAKAHKVYAVIDLRGYRRGYEPRLEIKGVYAPNPRDTFRLADGHLPPYQPTTTGDKLLSEMRRLGVCKAYRVAPITGVERMPKLSAKAVGNVRSRAKESDLEYLADSPELLTQTIAATGYRDRIDRTFQEAIARVKGIKGR